MNYNPQQKQALDADRQKDKEAPLDNKQPIKENSQPPKSFMRRLMPLGKSSRISEAKKSDLVFGVALAAGGFKDLLDIIQATGAGYALVIIMTILIFIFIGFMILIGIFLGGGGGLHILLMLFGGSMIEILPGIDFLPLTMATVIAIYWAILSKRKKDAAKMQESYA